jgi:hypothetical protein
MNGLPQRYYFCVALGVAFALQPATGRFAHAQNFKGEPTEGTIQLASGLAVRYQYFFDRNALRDACRTERATFCIWIQLRSVLPRSGSAPSRSPASDEAVPTVSFSVSRTAVFAVSTRALPL